MKKIKKNKLSMNEVLSSWQYELIVHSVSTAPEDEAGKSGSSQAGRPPCSASPL